MDFYQICVREIEKGPNKGQFEMYPDFTVGRSKDLMVRGRSFYAIWDEKAGLWSRDEYDVQRLVDQELKEYADKLREKSGVQYRVKYLRAAGNQGWYQFQKFVRNLSDNHVDLDRRLTFANTEVNKDDYRSKRLSYHLQAGDHSAWDQLVGTLYSVEQRAKIEWAIGAIASGDAAQLQKFMVFYGPPGSGKSTIINIVEKLFKGYTTTFDAKALGSSGAAFATEVFKDNPLVAIQHDGDLSKIEDNARLNSIVSHELMPMNEKYKPGYTARVLAFLLMGTNQPVKISDAKSGLLRRLIDVHPTGVQIPFTQYLGLMHRIDFELGAIAEHCLAVYQEKGKNYYDGYRPLEMMFQTDIFYNFIESAYDVFQLQQYTTLHQAYVLYKEFCSDTGIDKVLPMYKVREELRNYFDEFHDRMEIDGHLKRSVYSGFNANKYKEPTAKVATYKLVMEETASVLDKVLAAMPAQYGRVDEFGSEIPGKPWVKVKTTLSEIDTTELHYVKVPRNLITIDFDLTDENGNKSRDANLEAASSWPPTYAELSKGGEGVHLHYYWDGDIPVEELALNHSDGIEVKTLLGNASLRRRVSLCNNIEIATLATGLAAKEKKVLTDTQIRSEKGLRALVERNLRKEIHGSTKPSIDFIKKILDDAHKSGLQYNLEDMRPRIVAFANNSSNQYLQCLQIVQKMQFKGDETVAEGFKEPEKHEEKPLVFFDVEVYPNLFVICWKYAGDANLVRMINPSAQEVENLIYNYRLVGFNNRRYDNHILWGAYMGFNNQQIYELSQRIISNDRNGTFGEAYGLSWCDIWEFASKKMTLKKWQIELGLVHKEMDLPWDQPVPEELWDQVVDYCCNDVLSTEAVFQDRAQDYVARQILAAVSGLQVNDTTQRHAARICFGNDRSPHRSFQYTHLNKEFPGYEFELGKSTYRGEDPSEGGYVYAEEGMYENVAVLDVASMHPTSIRQLNLFGEYTKNFGAIVDARLAIKDGNYDDAKKMLNGALEPFLDNPADADALSYALKIVINIVYGMTSARFENPFKDNRNIDNIVAKRGALFMIDLKHYVWGLIEDKVIPEDCKVIHIKTDSIKISCPSRPDQIPGIVDLVQQYGEKYGYTFEHEATFEKMCLVNESTYIAKYGWAAKEKKIGTWDAVAAQFQEPYVFKSLFSGEDITFRDLCVDKSVVKGSIYLDFNQEEMPSPIIGDLHFVGRTGLFVPVTEASGGGTMWRVQENPNWGKEGEQQYKKFAVGGTKGHFWMEADMFQSRGDEVDLDMTYYEKLAVKAVDAIQKYGDFEKFSS